MQDKDIFEKSGEEAATEVLDAKNVVTSRDIIKDRVIAPDEEEDDQSQKVQAKDGKFTFRKMKHPKKEKAIKKKNLRLQIEGITFKAKLIGVEPVQDARGDKMCQDTMQFLKMNVKNLGPHKRKINICVSLRGIEIKDEKTGEKLHHHPVAMISFISQDITDARAFGYVAKSSDGCHNFIGIKTEKPAFHIVLALRNIFQTVLSLKQEKMDQVKEKKIDDTETNSSIGSNSLSEKSSFHEHSGDGISEEEKSNKEENIYFDVILTEPLTMKEPDTSDHVADDVKEAVKTVDDLLGLQDELNKLQEGIEQMDTSIAALSGNGANPIVEPDPFDTSFVNPSNAKIDGRFPQGFPILPQPQTLLAGGDKYAVFSDFSSEPSIFESALNKEEVAVPDLGELEEEIKKKFPPPAKPPRNSKTTAATDLSVFADLDPLGKDRPYKDKTEFFQDVKNPPKKVLNDLVDNKTEDLSSPASAFDLASSPVAFPVVSPATLGYSSSLPNSFLSSHLNFSVAYPQNPFNPFDKDNSTTNYFGNSSSNDVSFSIPVQNNASSPIPIPTRHQQDAANSQKSRTCSSNGSLGSPCSRSPIELAAHNGTSPSHLTNGTHMMNGNNIGPNKALQTNGVSRPRPRSSLSKVSPLSNNGMIANYHSPSVDHNANQRDSVAHKNGVKENGQRMRATSFPAEKKRDFTLPLKTADIFVKKSDPFGDEFFRPIPKRMNHLTKTEIHDYV